MFVTCPHCEDYIEILEINCAIFRHGQFKDTNIQLPPHSPKELCDRVKDLSLIYGCGKPFKIVDGKAEVCDYI